MKRLGCIIYIVIYLVWYKGSSVMKKSKIISDIKTEYYLVDRIVSEKDTVNSSLILEDLPRQSGSLKDESRFIIKKGGYILLDFGVELQGGLLISTHVANGANIRIIFGESAQEAMSGLGCKGFENMHSVRDYVINTGIQTTFETGNTGFRFVKISVDKDVYLNNIQAVCRMRNLEQRGSFECSDELLNKIWETGAYTVNLNVQEYIWDGIKRDRLVWVGDLNPEINTILAAFGDAKCIKESLDCAVSELKENKWLKEPSYSLWWFINQYELYMHSGDMDYLEQNREMFENISEQIFDEISEDGGYSFDNDYFVDWSSKGTPYEKAGFNSVLEMSLKSIINLSEIYGTEEIKNTAIKKLEIVKKNDFEYAGSKQVTALKYIAGDLDDNEAREILIKNGAEGLSCFMGFYVLKALARMGDVKSALDIIRQYWGGMLSVGATTFWEDFDIKWLENGTRIDELVPEGMTDVHGDNGKHCYKGFRHSLCHGWASGPTGILSRYVLGVKIEEAGCKKIRITPNLGDLDYARGSFPTPYGEIRIEHTKKDGKIITKVNAPLDVTIIGDNKISISNY